MRVSIINLGDSNRGLYDINNRFVSVPIGEIVSADLSDKTLRNLTKFQKTDTLLVGPVGTFRPPVKLRSVLELLKIIDDEPYESLLRQFLEIHSPRSSIELRPNRGQMRVALRGLVEQHLRSIASETASRADSDDAVEARRSDLADAERRRADAAAASRKHDQRRQSGRRR